jgi:hypothetical protein
MEALVLATAMLCLIAKDWLDARYLGTQQGRLEMEEDRVRREIGKAL